MCRLAITLLCTGALAATSLAPAAQADNCDYSLARCNYVQTQTLVLPMRNVILTALVKPHHTRTAMALYRQLLPPGYGVPADPHIGIYYTSVDIPNSSALDSTVQQMWGTSHYLEGSISLETVHDGEVGFYHLGMPMTDQGAHDSGYPIGYPKYFAKMTSQSTGNGGWFVDAKVNGTTTYSMGFKPADVTLDKASQDFSW